MPLSNYALDAFVAQDLSKLTACAPQTLTGAFPDRAHWFNQFVLRRILQNHVADEKAALAFVLVRRAEAALDEWEAACETAKDDVRQPSTYFKLLRHLESCISALWQGLEFGRKAVGTALFQKGDASVYERLNWIYNVSRHFDPEALLVGDLHRVWVTNDGVHTREHALAFDEIREALQLLGRVAEKVGGASPTHG